MLVLKALHLKNYCKLKESPRKLQDYHFEKLESIKIKVFSEHGTNFFNTNYADFDNSRDSFID